MTAGPHPAQDIRSRVPAPILDQPVVTTGTEAALPPDPADREATVRSEVLNAVSAYGGEVIIAGPPMERLVGDLTDLFLGWLANP